MQFLRVAQVFEEVELTGARTEMAGMLAALFADAKREEIKPLIYLCQGILLPPFEGLELGIGEKLTQAAISKVSGHKESQIEEKFKKLGDFGLAAKWACENKKQMALGSHELDMAEVYSSLCKLARMSGHGSQDSKIGILSELLNSASGLEAKFIVRFCVGKMRLGVAEPTMLDAVTLMRAPAVRGGISGIIEEKERLVRIKIDTALCEKEDGWVDDSKPSLTLWFRVEDGKVLKISPDSEISLSYGEGFRASKLKVIKIKRDEHDLDLYRLELQGFKKAVRAPVERAYNLCSDLGLAIELALYDYHKIEKFPLKLFSPIRPALAERLPDAKSIIDKIGPCAVEGKYDGFRLQVHKDGKRVELYSRKLERVTGAFPEIVEAAAKLEPKRLIFEGEALAFDVKEKRYYSFQMTIQRKRKHGIEKMRADFPLKLFAFDVMYIDGVDWTLEPYERRRAELEALVKNVEGIEPSALKQVRAAGELENFFEQCIAKGLEGIIAKDLLAIYTPGAREFAWIKLKRSYGAMADTLDTVIVGYYLGEGQRAEFGFGGLLVAVRNENTGNLQTIARIGSGFSEEEMAELSERLGKMRIGSKPNELDAKVDADFWVEPKLVATVSADEISLSPMHTAGWAGEKGYALRFPRLVQIREDKGINDITTTAEVEQLYSIQRSKGK